MRKIAGLAALIVTFVAIACAGALAQDTPSPDQDCRKTGPVDVVIDACSRALAAAGSDVAVYLSRRADGYWAKGDRAAAVADYSASYRIRPSDGHVLGRLGMAKVNDRKFRAALPQLDESLRLDPTQAAVYAARGKAHFELGEIERAFADMDVAVRVSPEPDAGIMFTRGNYNLAAGRLSAALDDYNAVLASVDYVGVYPKRGVAYLLSRDPEKAMADLNEAVRLWPEKSNGALEARGRAHFYLGQFAEARADFDAALELDPGDAYLPIWIELVNREDHQPSRLRKDAANVPINIWPGALVQYLLGQKTEQQARDAAAVDPEAARDRFCELEYYTGELARIAGDAKNAGELFLGASRRCPAEFVERESAVVRLLPPGALSAAKPGGGDLSVEE